MANNDRPRSTYGPMRPTLLLNTNDGMPSVDDLPCDFLDPTFRIRFQFIYEIATQWNIPQRGIKANAAEEDSWMP